VNVVLEYFCPTHLHITTLDGKPIHKVNWKGNGCELCAADNFARQAKKEFERKRRAARRNGEKFESDQEEE
jgi:hypothetical protein